MPFFDTITEGLKFEYYCAVILERNGFNNVEVTQASGDYGIDVLAERDGVTFAIQCKLYSSHVGNSAVQEAASGRDFYKKDIAVVMTNNYFTDNAIKLASAIGVKLWDRDKLEALEGSAGFTPITENADGEETDSQSNSQAESVLPPSPSGKPKESDPLLDAAINLLKNGGEPSVSCLQRNLKVGYARACRLLPEAQNFILAEKQQSEIIESPSPAEESRAEYIDLPSPNRNPPRNKNITLILCIFLGVLGVHRFYVYAYFTGFLYLITGGFLGIGWLIDTIRIILGKFPNLSV